MSRRLKTLSADQALHTTAFGLILTAALDHRGLSQAVFGEKTGMGQATISRLCNGKVVPDLLHIIRIEEVLGVAPGSILSSLPAAHPAAKKRIESEANKHGVPVI